MFKRVTIGLAATGLLFALSPAAHAATDPNDPYNSGCYRDAYAVGTAYIAKGSPNTSGNTGFGALHLMYSPSCNKNWAEFDNYPSGHEFALVVWSDNNGFNAGYQQEPWTSHGDEVAWTDMVNGAYPAGVGLCEDSTSGSVQQTAYLMQDRTDGFNCSPDQGWGILW